MGIFSRLSDIVNSNLNAMCDSAEDPEKMIRLIIQEMEDTLVEVRSASARILADKKTQQRQLAALKEQVVSWEAKAKLAISKDREDLARAALLEKRRLESEVTALEGELGTADDHIEQVHDEVSQLQAKLDDAKAKLKNPEDEIKKKLQEELSRKTGDDQAEQKSFEDQAKDKIEKEIGNALKKLFD